MDREYKHARFVAALYEHRRRRGLTQETLAEHLGVTQGTVSGWETGVTTPAFDHLCDLAVLLDLSLDRVLLDADTDELARLRAFRREVGESLRRVA